MAFQQAHTDAFGSVHSQSFWILETLSLDFLNKAAFISFAGYIDYTAFSGGKKPIEKKTYNITSSTFDTYFSEAVLASATPQAKSYAYALATHDTGGVSFFNGASTVDGSGNPVGP